MRAQFVMSETVIGLRRNVTLTIAVVLTVTISLTLMGVAMLLRQQVNVINDVYQGKLQVQIFLSKTVTPSQRDALQQMLESDPAVRQVVYESKAEAYQRFKREFSNSPELVKGATPDQLPESFRIRLKQATKDAYDEIATRYQDQPGVSQVYNQRQVLDQVFRILHFLQRGALGVALLQFAAAVLLIFNTIRVAAFNRRRETGIMRLVGASNLYIQLPFLLEAALAGLVGGLFACSGLAASKILLLDRIKLAIIPPLGWGDVLGTMPLLLIVSVALSSGVSLLTLRRFLRV